MTEKRKIPELVAPAGSMATFQAGLRAGADAFYLGVGTLNARGRARNFTLEELETVANAAREHHRKVYLALNVLVPDGEVRECVRVLERAEACGLDAVIIQDLGVLYLLRKYFPALRVHASTQMFLHNSLHLRALVDRGVSRVILPRELRLEEIQAIRSRVAVELEVFVHGALCFSFSGLCLASSWLLGESGNRGVCKQVCRFACEAAGPEGRHPFAMKDLEGRTCLAALLDSGVESLKIEGRLRNTDYVEEVVGYYRRCLDDHAAGRPLPAPPVWRLNRATTPGYFLPQAYSDMICTHGETWIGERVGRVARFRGGRATLVFDRPVFRGERLRILRANGVKVHEFTLLDRKGSGCEVEVGRQAAPFADWGVFRVGTSQAPPRRSPRGDGGTLQGCPARLEIRHGQGVMQVEAVLRDALHFRADFPVGPASAGSPLAPDRVRDCFLRVDRAPFRIEAIAVTLEEPLALPIRDLNAVRREFYRRLQGFLDGENATRDRRRRQDVQKEFEELGSRSRRAEADPGRGAGGPGFRAVSGGRRDRPGRDQAAGQTGRDQAVRDAGQGAALGGRPWHKARLGCRDCPAGAGDPDGGEAGPGPRACGESRPRPPPSGLSLCGACPAGGKDDRVGQTLVDAGGVGVTRRARRSSRAAREGWGGSEAGRARPEALLRPPGRGEGLLPGLEVVSWEDYLEGRATGRFGGQASAAGGRVPGEGERGARDGGGVVETGAAGQPARPPGAVWVELPLFVSEEALPGVVRELERAIAADDVPGFVCHSLGWVDHLRVRVPGERIAAGGFLYCFNRFAYELLRRAGAGRILLSPDFLEEDVRDLLGFEGTAPAREECRRFFVTRQALPATAYRLGKRTLEVLRRREYSEVVWPPGD